MNYANMLAVAFAEAQAGFDEGGVPVGAALFDAHGNLLGRGRNRRVQDNDPSIHGETDAFRKAGRQTNYRDTILVTTLGALLVLLGFDPAIQYRHGGGRRIGQLRRPPGLAQGRRGEGH